MKKGTIAVKKPAGVKVGTIKVNKPKGCCPECKTKAKGC